MGEKRGDMGEFRRDFSRWLKERPESVRKLIAWIEERPKLIRRPPRRRSDRVTVELYDPKSGIVVLRRFLSPEEFEKFREEYRAGRWPDLDWRLV